MRNEGICPPALYRFNGFFAPVDTAAGVLNMVKGGATVPLKFRVYAGSTEITDPAVMGPFTVKAIPLSR